MVYNRIHKTECPNCYNCFIDWKNTNLNLKLISEMGASLTTNETAPTIMTSGVLATTPKKKKGNLIE